MENETGQKVSQAQATYDWVIARLDEKRTVFITTYGHSLKITNKYRDCLRVKNGFFEVQRGRHWDAILPGGCKITAR